MRRALAALALVLVAAAPAAAQRSLVIGRFDATIDVATSGDVRVEETISPRFTGTWNGIYRTIPIQYRTPQGLNYTLQLRIESITDESGTPLKYETSHERQYLKIKIWVPDAVNASRTVKLTYRVANALRFFDDHDELYWNVTGDQWDVPIESASARINLPAVTGVRATAFRGAFGSTAQNEVTIEGQTVRLGTDGLGMHEGLTVVVGWNPGVVHRPTALEQTMQVFKSNLPLGLPIVVFVGMLYLWRSRGRDPTQAPIVTKYDPPDGLTPSELGTLVDGSPDMRDITASIVDLAVRGYLHIEEVKTGHLLLMSSTDYKFTLTKDRSSWDALKPHERAVLTAMFGVGDSVLLSDLKNKFYRSLPAIKNGLEQMLVDGGYYTARPDRVRAIYVAVGIAFASLILVAGSNAMSSMGMQQAPAVIAGILSGAIIIAFGWFMPCRTAKGAREQEQILGFQEFLGRVDADRMKRMVKTPEMFETFLPFAMALGVENHWAKAFDGIYKQAPQWYTGYGPMQAFSPMLFTSSLSRMSVAASNVMASAPRGSGGSGFSGGSSGGGFGGGG
ncbi:MAG TPA: DUF2207 domain-containing protein, partial [Vicinamibacterales bacterium]